MPEKPDSYTTLIDQQRRERMEREKAEQLERERRERDRRTSQTTTLPCPFCGRPPNITKHHKEAMWRLVHSCEVVGSIMIDWRDDASSHLRSWNRRSK